MNDKELMTLGEIMDFFANAFAEKINPTDEEVQRVVASCAALKDDAERKEVMDKIASLETTNAELVDKINEMQNKLTEITNKNKPSNKMEEKTIDKATMKAYASKVFNRLMKSTKEQSLHASLEEVAAEMNLNITNAGIDVPETLYPHMLFSEVMDNLNRDDSFLPFLRYLGASNIDIPQCLFGEGENDVAGGHKKGEQKVVQTKALTPKSIKKGTVYKLTKLAYEIRREWETNLDIMRWVYDELFQHVVDKIEECILVGDTTGTSNRKITSYESIIAAGTNYTASVASKDALLPNKEDIVAARAAIKTRGRKILAISAEALANLRKLQYSVGGTPSYIPMDALKQEFDVDEIIVRDYVNAENGALAIIFTADYYGIVGDMNPSSIEAYDIMTNEHEVEMVSYSGGGVMKYHSAAFVTPAA